MKHIKNVINLLGFIISMLLTITVIKCCNNAEKPNSSFAKEVAKESRKVYDDVREGLKLDSIKKDTINKDTTNF